MSGRGKNFQVTLLVFLVAGSTFFYYQAFVSLDARIKAIESALPPEPTHPLSLPEKDASLEVKQQAIATLFNVAIPDEPGIPGVLGRLAKSARLAGIQGVSMATQERHADKSLGTEMALFRWPIRLRFMSEYAALAEFVHALQGLTRVVELQQVSMRRLPPGVATEINLVVYSQSAPPVILAKASNPKSKASQDEMMSDDELPMNPSRDESELFSESGIDDDVTE